MSHTLCLYAITIFYFLLAVTQSQSIYKKKKKVSRSEGIGTELFHIGNMLQNCLSTIAGVHSCKKP